MRTLRLSLLAMMAAAAAWTQSRPAINGSAGADQARIDRGRYIVESVAMCEQCHTQRDEHGIPDHAHWLMGGPVNYRPSYSDPAWAQREPRIAGAPPGTDAEIIRLLTTGISRTGKPPASPMPPFRMTRDDAEAVLAYLKSL